MNRYLIVAGRVALAALTGATLGYTIAYWLAI